MAKKAKLGHAFFDELIKVSRPSDSFLRSVNKSQTTRWEEALITGDPSENTTELVNPWRRIFVLIILLLSFSGLILRLFHLQIVEGKAWRDLADSNRVKVKIIHAPRGVIYDRSGKILAQNEPGFRLLEQAASNSGVISSKIISRDEALRMEVKNDPRFKDLEIDNLRSYPLGEEAAHVLGYISQINQKELNDPKFENYKIGDQVGRGGVEEIYEKTLKGVDGGEIIEVDSSGNKIRSLSKTDPIPGQNLYLTIDLSFQKVVYKNLVDGIKKTGSCCGAAVVEDPNSGQILALVSYPSFDPKNVGASLADPSSPLLNRVIGGTYPPGSTFKIASALAGLSSGKITAKTEFEDTGVIYLGTFKFANWYFTDYGKTEGTVDIVKAIKRSNDTYFYHLGETIGEEKLAETARALSLGKILGIDLPGEVPGLIADDEWKKKVIGESWFPGDTLHTAIGQGFTLLTPLQNLNLISTIAASGRQYPPHLALKITSPSGRVVKQFKFDAFTNAEFKKDQIALVKSGLTQVPAPGGTAWPFFTFPIPTGGKTGTAEYGDPKDRTHAWYTSFAPADNPKISMAVLVEGGGEGSNVAAPITKEVYRWYFSKDKNNLIKDVYFESSQSARSLGE